MPQQISKLQDTRRNNDSINHLLKSKGIEPSMLRLKIASVLLSKIQHLTVNQIRHRLKHNNNMISDNAMSNTLRLFRECNLVREVFVDSKTVFYDSNTSTHSHFYNANTGELVDIPTMSINIYETTPALLNGEASKLLNMKVR